MIGEVVKIFIFSLFLEYDYDTLFDHLLMSAPSSDLDLELSRLLLCALVYIKSSE